MKSERLRTLKAELDADMLIDDLRAFRHVFRNIYQGDLDTGKLKLVDSRIRLPFECSNPHIESSRPFSTG